MTFINKYLKSSVYVLLLFVAAFCGSCKKLIVDIPPPTSTITTSQVFKDSSDANAAILGIYSQMINTSNPVFTSGAITLYCGSSADELINFVSVPDYDQVYFNSVQANNVATYGDLWLKAYSTIYQANAAIEGLQASKGINQTARTQFTGEARFIRAFCYFYLVNLFGDVPYITSTDWQETSKASRVNKDQIYDEIVSDLKYAQSSLRPDYSISSGERTRANQAAATALLARVYLYRKDYQNADVLSSTLLANSNYGLTLLDDVFLKNSDEAIFQLSINPGASSIANETPEGRSLVPGDLNSAPNYYLNPTLLHNFETGDQRQLAWVDSSNFNGTVYYYAHKYKIGTGQSSTSFAPEYYMVLRLAEQYLINAEAKAQLDNLSGAVSDLNAIRQRAGLPALPNSLTKDQVLLAVKKERQIELFCEWGHRWLDLKRWGQVDSVMSVITPQKNGGADWKSYQQLYPIPFDEISKDPHLTQNPGY